jgi:hypothetical protein
MNLSITKKNPVVMNTIALKVGLWMFAGYAAFFLLMYAIGLGHRSELRVFNGVIQIAGLYYAIKLYYKNNPEHISNYLYGVAQGMKVTGVSVIAFSIFMCLFLYMNPSLMQTIQQYSFMGDYLNPFTATMFIVTEGVVIGIIASYILTRILEAKLNKG